MIILLTGNLGFIMSHLNNKIRKLYPDATIIGVDAETYAADRSRIDHYLYSANMFMLSKAKKPKYVTFQAKANLYSVDSSEYLFQIFDKIGYPDIVFHGAAESSVDKSLKSPLDFWQTNVVGTRALLEDLLIYSVDNGKKFPKFISISTDETIAGGGTLDQKFPFDEDSPLNPTSDYASSKAAAELAVKSFMKRWSIEDWVIVRSVNNYGPGQHKEKLIPTVIDKLLKSDPVEIYGDGKHMRDWIHVDDFVAALLLFIEKPWVSGVYNISSNEELSNNEMVFKIIEASKVKDYMITSIPDPRGAVHDLRYFISSKAFRIATGWKPLIPFDKGIVETVESYVQK